MINWTLADGRHPSPGIFFVSKSNGTLRIIFDTRLANLDFSEPPCMALPTANAIGKVESESGPCFIATGDLEWAFYNMGLPEALASRFRLPTISAGNLGLAHLDGLMLNASTHIMSQLAIIPMGWSWSLHLCQSVLNHAIQRAGVLSSNVVDGQCASFITNHRSTVTAGYADNFATLGSDPEAVEKQRDRNVDVLQNDFRLLCHDISPMSQKWRFCWFVIYQW